MLNNPDHSANGDMDDELVHFEMREIRANVELDVRMSGVSFAAFFKTRGNIRRFFIIIMLGTLTQVSWMGPSDPQNTGTDCRNSLQPLQSSVTRYIRLLIWQSGLVTGLFPIIWCPF